MVATKVKSGKEVWTCPKCGRQFARKGQAHSCKLFPLVNHFRGKPDSEILYRKLKRAVGDTIGPFKVESLQCCIHFVNRYTFAAIVILKNKIRIDFSLARKIRSSRIVKSGLLSASRYLYCVDVSNEREIDGTLLGWMKTSYESRP